ncbi:hypothetical protein IT087_03665 [Candidatus Uhrbacteria bacterium]|nr:hypothetical protein [Candidatus Uhrbacteria bacterium]
MGKKKLAKKGPSSEELASLDREVQAVLPRTNIGKHRRFSLTDEQHLHLFRLLRPCIALMGEKNPQLTLCDDPIAKTIFNLLWSLNYGLAVTGARLFGPPWYQDDTVQDALLGLRKGLLRFDPERGTKPSAYIMWWVRSEVTKNGVNSRRGAITLRQNALRQIKDGKVERPVVFSYHAVAHRQDIEDVEHARFMGDYAAVPSDKRFEARQAFDEWRRKLAEAAAEVERECQVEYLLFSLESGYGRYPKGPVRMKVLKRLTGVKERDIHRKVEKVIERIGRRCGFRKLSEARYFIDAMVEYSLHLGIPL